MATKDENLVFDYRILRLLIGIIAFALPFTVSLIADGPLDSISAAYHTDARNVFVGMLFFISAFLCAYNGHRFPEPLLSRIASLAAIIVAVFPTASDGSVQDISSKIHFGAAFTLFAILTYFCLGPFRKNTKRKGGPKGRRSRIYLTCGWIMILCMVSIPVAKFALSEELKEMLRITYWGEAIALAAFGVAWLVAGKSIPGLAEKDEAHPFLRKRKAA